MENEAENDGKTAEKQQKKRLKKQQSTNRGDDMTRVLHCHWLNRFLSGNDVDELSVSG